MFQLIFLCIEKKYIYCQWSYFVDRLDHLSFNLSVFLSNSETLWTDPDLQDTTDGF